MVTAGLWEDAPRPSRAGEATGCAACLQAFLLTSQALSFLEQLLSFPGVGWLWPDCRKMCSSLPAALGNRLSAYRHIALGFSSSSSHLFCRSWPQPFSPQHSDGCQPQPLEHTSSAEWVLLACGCECRVGTVASSVSESHPLHYPWVNWNLLNHTRWDPPLHHLIFRFLKKKKNSSHRRVRRCVHCTFAQKLLIGLEVVSGTFKETLWGQASWQYWLRIKWYFSILLDKNAGFQMFKSREMKINNWSKGKGQALRARGLGLCNPLSLWADVGAGSWFSVDRKVTWSLSSAFGFCFHLVFVGRGGHKQDGSSVPSGTFLETVKILKPLRISKFIKSILQGSMRNYSPRHHLFSLLHNSFN